MRRSVGAMRTGALILLGVGLGRCGGYERGIEVQLAFQTAPSTLGFDTDMGFEVRLEEAILAIRSVELVPCVPRSVGFRFDPWSLIEGTAWAHVDDNPALSDGLPVLDALHSQGVPVVAATMRPAPGRYCALRMTFFVEESTEVAEGGAEPMSLKVKGVAHGAAGAHPFALETQVGEPVEIPFAVELELSEANLDASIVVVVDQRRWFDGIDFSTASTALRGSRIVDNVMLGLSTYSRVEP